MLKNKLGIVSWPIRSKGVIFFLKYVTRLSTHLYCFRNFDSKYGVSHHYEKHYHFDYLMRKIYFPPQKKDEIGTFEDRVGK